MANSGRTIESIKRRSRLDDATAKHKFPTSEGNRPLSTRGPSLKERLKGKPRELTGNALSKANQLRGTTDKAAEGINARKKYKEVE